MRLYEIYEITNVVNGKRYIGKTYKGLKERFRKHTYDALVASRDTALCNAIRKHGINSFNITPLESDISEDIVNKIEQEWIAYLKSKAPYGYNLTDGGDGGAGREWTDEQRLKCSRIVNNFVGKHHSDESKKKMSESHKGIHAGHRNPNYGKRGVLSPIYGRKPTEEQRKKLSDSLKGRIFTPEWKNKLRKARLGQTMPQETKLKLSLKLKGRKRGPMPEETKRKLSDAARIRYGVKEEQVSKLFNGE